MQFYSVNTILLYSTESHCSEEGLEGPLAWCFAKTRGKRKVVKNTCDFTLYRIVWSNQFLRHALKEMCCTGHVVRAAIQGALFSRNGVTWSNSSGQSGKEVAIAQKKLLNNVTGKHQLYMSWWRIVQIASSTHCTKTLQRGICCDYRMQSIGKLKFEMAQDCSGHHSTLNLKFYTKTIWM